MGKAYFYKLFSDNSIPNGVFSRGFFTFYFLTLDFIFSLSERKFHMIFSQFPAAVVLFGHFSGHWRCGPGGGWKVPEKGFKMLSGCPCGVKNTLLCVLWRKGDQNRPFGPIRRLAFGVLGVGLRQGGSTFSQTF